MSGSGTHALAPMISKLTRRSQLGPLEIEALLALPHRLATIDPGRYVIREGDRAETCVLLCSGFVYRNKMSGFGARQILSIHLRGDLVDLQNSLLGYADSSVQALTKAVIAYIPQQAIREVAEVYATVARALWRDMLVDSSIHQEWILNLGQRNARQRVSHLICEIALRQEEALSCKGPDYAWPLTQEHVGDATGLTSVHVNRTLQGLRQEGLIKTGSRTITVPNMLQLQKAGDFAKAYLHQTTLAA